MQQNSISSPSKITKTKKTFSSSLSLNQWNDDDNELIRSSSCGDLPSSKLNSKQNEINHNQSIFDQFVQQLTCIRTISNQIRTRLAHITNGKNKIQ